MLYFLENHDELRIANDYFAGQPERAIPALMTSVWMYRGPFMLYFGQEFGEPGMDNEGFSGINGRTTIFDYWCVESLRRGFFDRKQLTAGQLSLEKQYQQILRIARTERAIEHGEMFDLMYVNQHLAHKQYAFLRKWKNDLLLIVVNFADHDIHCDVNLPAHAFDFLQIDKGEYTAAELLSGMEKSLLLSDSMPLHLEVAANGGAIWKIKL